MQRLGTCLCVLASALCCSGQGSGIFYLQMGGVAPTGGDQGHGALRFTVTIGTPRTFEDARAFCGTDKYLLNLRAAVNVSHVQATFQQNGLDSSYVWLNMRMIQGFFHWLDPIPQLFKQTFSLPYGDVIGSHNYHHGCVVLNTSSGAIETRPCDEQHPFICIEDKQLRPLHVSEEAVSVELTSNQPPVLLSWNLPNLRLRCRAKLRNGTVLREASPGNYAYAHVWTKNGVFLDHTYPSLQPEKVSEPNAYTHSYVSSQGRYRCGLKALPSGSIAWSNVVTVVLEDFDTYRLTGHIFHTVDPGPIQFIGSSFVAFARNIEAALTGVQFSVRWSYSGITTDDTDRVKISLFIYYKRPELASTADASGGEPDIFNHSTALDNFITINNITDVLHCNFVQQGAFIFHSEGHVGLVESTPPCLTESHHLVPRYCDMNFESEPTWAPFEESTCKAETRSRAFDVHTDTHHLLCSPRHCVPQSVFGAWSEVRRLCNSLRGYLASDGPGSWTDIVKKHGYLQSESAGHPQVLEAFKMSELLSPIVLPEGANAASCFIVNPVQDQLQPRQSSDSVTQTSCSDELAGSCAFRYRAYFRGLNPCPRGGWLDLSSKNTCLWLNLSPLDFDQAAEMCRASNGHLAFVDNSSLSYTLALLLAPREVPREFDRYWIGLQRSPDGVYKWGNGHPLREFAWHPRTDYKQSAGTLFVDRYSVQWGLTLRYSLEDPRRKLPSICQADLQTGAPWLRVEQRNSGRRVGLTCRVSAEIIPGSVLWYKDGIAVQGDRASTPDGHDTTLVIEGATPANPYLQGYYWCEGMSVADFRPVESKKTLVRFPGIKTYACTIPLVGQHPELYDFTSVVALRFASDFRRDFFYAVRDTIVEGYHMYELQVVDIAQDTVSADVVRFLLFFNRLRRLPRMTSHDEELRIIDFLKSTISNSTSRLITIPPVLPDAMSIRSTEMCFEDTTMHDTGLQKELTWPATPTGGVAIPQETCIQGDGQPAVRRCEGNFTTGAYWGNVQGTCERLASDRTLDLRNLSLEVVTNATMVPTAERLQELTADSGSLGAQDVLYVATTLENIVSAGAIEVETATDIASTVNHVLNADSQVLQHSRSGNSTNRILTAVEDASAALSTVTVIISGSVALGKVGSAEAARGIAIHLRDNSTYNFSDPESLTRGTDAAFMLSEANASMPRLAIGLMQSSALFQEMPRSDNESEVEVNDGNGGTAYEVCTSVLQVKYDSDDGAANSTRKDVRFSFYFRQTCDVVPDEIECVFWDVNENERLGSWSGDGCEYLGNVHGYHLCNCTHLTSFAVIFKYDKSKSGRNVHDAILSYLTLIGVAVSGLGLFMVVLTYILFKKWRKGAGHQILFNLCLALLGALASFVAMAMLPKHSASLVSCTCVGAALHYFLLVSFAWTFIESLLQYLRFVRVLGAYVPNLVLKAAFGAWGAPMLVILCVLIVNPTQYHKRKDFCWLEAEALLYSFLLPVGLILAANVIVFSVVVFSIYCRRQKGLRSTQSQVQLAKAQLRATICIVFLLGLTWIFAYLSLIEAVSKEWGRLFEYLFVITSSLQGLVIFIFHIAYEKTAREFWLGQFVYRVWPYNKKTSFDHHGSSKATLSSSAQKTTTT